MAKYRSSASALAKTFERSSAMVYLVDPSGTILYANPACEAWAGAEAGGLFGRSLRTSPPAPTTELGLPVDDGLSALTPPPEIFAEPGVLIDPIRFLICSPESADPQARMRYRWAMAYALPEPDQDEICVLIVSQPTDLTEKPVSPPDHSASNQAHVALRELRLQNRLTYRLECLVGISSFSGRLRRQALMAASSQGDLYLCGPVGSGKEYLARIIHANRPQAANLDLVPVQCSFLDGPAIQKLFQELNLKRQQPVRRKDNASSEASPPASASETLLLLNADRLTREAQIEFLRQLRSTPSFGSLISTGERALRQLAAEGQFETELASLLSTTSIDLIPLWQRAEDIPFLAQSILERTDGKQTVAGIDASAIQLLIEYRWPGNLDQLQEVLLQAAEHVQHRMLTSEDLPRKFHDRLAAQRMAPVARPVIDAEKFLESIERELILRAIGQAKGNKSQAANLLTLSRAKLLRRIEALNLAEEIEQFFPATESVMEESIKPKPARTKKSGSSDEPREPSDRPDRGSRLRDKLLRKPPVEALNSEDIADKTADDADWNDEDWVTPDAFEEIE